MTFEIQGLMHSKKDKVQVSEKFAKRDFIIHIPNEKNSQYPDYVSFQCTQDRCDLLKGISKNDLVKVSFNVNGNLAKNKQGEDIAYNNLNVWKIEVVSKANEQTPPKKESVKTPPPAADLPSDTDDLPF
jgi:hypothetical protein